MWQNSWRRLCSFKGIHAARDTLDIGRKRNWLLRSLPLFRCNVSHRERPIAGGDLVSQALPFQKSEPRCDDAKRAILVGSFHSLEPVEIEIGRRGVDKPGAGADNIVQCIAIKAVTQWDK